MTNGHATVAAQPPTEHAVANAARHEDAEHALRLVAVILEDNWISTLQCCRDACLAVIADALGLDMPVSVDSVSGRAPELLPAPGIPRSREAEGPRSTAASNPRQRPIS